MTQNISASNKLTPSTITLHRYFIWADRMKVHFDDVLKSTNSERRIDNSFKKKEEIETFMYMSLWYATFYVLIEGWIELKFSDPRIDTMLKSKNVDLLRRYRNGTFHFQKEYDDERFMKLMIEGQDFANWIRDLRDEFSRWFLEIYRNIPKDKLNE